MCFDLIHYFVTNFLKIDLFVLVFYSVKLVSPSMRVFWQSTKKIWVKLEKMKEKVIIALDIIHFNFFFLPKIKFHFIFFKKHHPTTTIQCQQTPSPAHYNIAIQRLHHHQTYRIPLCKLRCEPAFHCTASSVISGFHCHLHLPSFRPLSPNITTITTQHYPTTTCT